MMALYGIFSNLKMLLIVLFVPETRGKELEETAALS